MSSPTRQQLEELDALLQRMLSLPVNQSHPQPAPMPPPPPAPPVAAPPPAAATYTFTSPPPGRPVAPRPAVPPRPVPAMPRRHIEVAPGDNSWNVPLPAAGVSVYGQWPGGVDPLTAAARTALAPPPAPAPAPPGTLRVATIPSPDEQNRSRDNPPPMQRLRQESMMNEMAAPNSAVYPQAAQTPRLPVQLWPVVALDWTLGKALGLLLGPPGRWLGQGSGKFVVGWCGVLMLCGAIAWGVVDYFGLSW